VRKQNLRVFGRGVFSLGTFFGQVFGRGVFSLGTFFGQAKKVSPSADILALFLYLYKAKQAS
jgi:hypothetical protein